MITFERIEKKSVGQSNNAETGIGNNPFDYVVNNQTMDDLRGRDKQAQNSKINKAQDRTKGNGKNDHLNPILDPKIKSDLKQVNFNSVKADSIQDEFKDILNKNSTAKQLLDMANQRSSKVSNNQIPEVKVSETMKISSDQIINQNNVKDFRSMFTKSDRQLDLLTDQFVRSLLPDKEKSIKRYHPNDKKGLAHDQGGSKIINQQDKDSNQVAGTENPSKNYSEENLKYKDNNASQPDQNILANMFPSGLAFNSQLNNVPLTKNDFVQNEKNYKSVIKNLSSGIKSAVRELSNNSTVGKFKLESDEYGEITIHLYKKQNDLEIQIDVEDEMTNKYLKENQSSIVEKLDSSGITVKSIQINHTQNTINSGMKQVKANPVDILKESGHMSMLPNSMGIEQYLNSQNNTIEFYA